MNRKITRYFSMTALLLAAAVTHAANEPTHQALKLVNLTNFAASAVRDTVMAELPEFGSRVASSKYALWLSVDAFPMNSGKTYCFAMAGLTIAAKEGRAERIPPMRYAHLSTRDGALSAAQSTECKTTALLGAIRSLSKDDWNEQAKKADAETSDGGNYAKVKAYPPSAYISIAGNADVQQIVVPSQFPIAFDHRYFQIAVVSESFISDGTAVCFAEVGVAARSPLNKMSRTPEMTYPMLIERPLAALPGRSEEEKTTFCESSAATEAVNSMLKDSWDQNGFLHNIEATREQGIPMKYNVNVSSKVAAAKTLPQTSSVQGRVTQCTNRCVNGACIRTFSDGRTEKWQAPQVFNPISNQWEWKTDSCGR